MNMGAPCVGVVVGRGSLSSAFFCGGVCCVCLSLLRCGLALGAWCPSSCVFWCWLPVGWCVSWFVGLRAGGACVCWWGGGFPSVAFCRRCPSSGVRVLVAGLRPAGVGSGCLLVLCVAVSVGVVAGVAGGVAASVAFVVCGGACPSVGGGVILLCARRLRSAGFFSSVTKARRRDERRKPNAGRTNRRSERSERRPKKGAQKKPKQKNRRALKILPKRNFSVEVHRPPPKLLKLIRGLLRSHSADVFAHRYRLRAKISLQT